MTQQQKEWDMTCMNPFIWSKAHMLAQSNRVVQMVIGKNLAFWLYHNSCTHLFSRYVAWLLFIPNGEAKTHSYESGTHCVGQHCAQTFHKYLSLPIGNQPLCSIPPTSTDLSLVYFSWEEYEDLERNLEKEHIVHQRDFTSFFLDCQVSSAFCCVCCCEINDVE